MASGTEYAYSGRPRRGLFGGIFESIADLGAYVLNGFETLGDMTMFAWRTFMWLITRLPRRETLFANMYQIGVLSLPVVALTGTFIGMVLAVQSYTQFRAFGLETQLGGVINKSMFRELGPVLAATMLAGASAVRWRPSWARCASPSKSTPWQAWAPIQFSIW